MTQHLETLKGILQKVLSGSVEGEDYKEALVDGAYACDLSLVALQGWLDIWTNTEYAGYAFCEYTKGVQFVAEQWDRILSGYNEGEE
ncbi:hypothetical protein D3C86_1652170 [compost metagenome]